MNSIRSSSVFLEPFPVTESAIDPATDAVSSASSCKRSLPSGVANLESGALVPGVRGEPFMSDKDATDKRLFVRLSGFLEVEVGVAGEACLKAVSEKCTVLMKPETHAFCCALV